MLRYTNPVVSGMYPDPSVCAANGKFYMVCSSMNYFPCVPLFESEDLIQWKQIGHCLTRDSQVDLTGARIYSGIFAPTIRFHEGRFYMVTTNAVGHDNFYVYTDDIYGEWSEPIFVDQEGIDPTLFFDDGHWYFISNGGDAEGSCIIMSEIDIETGRRLTEPKALWRGNGGRFMEAPHLYRVGEYYYALDAEGGTEYGHMACYARSRSLWGPYENYPGNPVLTNRNLGGYSIQGAGHGDLVCDNDGNWWFVHLAFRQQGMWTQYHHLGREVFLVPVKWGEDGWFTMGDGCCREAYEFADRAYREQEKSYRRTIASMCSEHQWCHVRKKEADRYVFAEDSLQLLAKAESISGGEFPVMAAVRQCEFCEEVCVAVSSECDEAGISIYMDEAHHYDLYLENGAAVVLRYTIGPVTKEMCRVLAGGEAQLRITSNPYQYQFYANGQKLGQADTKYVTTEVAGGFTGVVTGFYAVDKKERTATFRSLSVTHMEA